MRKFLSIFFILFSFGLFAADTVRIDGAASMVVSGTTNASMTIGSDSPSGDATSESAPAKVYIPIVSAAGNQNYTILSANLYNIATGSHVVTYPLITTLGSTAKYIYAAVKYAALGTSYYVTAKSSLIAANQTNASTYFSLSPLDICKPISGNGNTACANLAAASTTETSIKPIVYFFLSDESLDVTGLTTIDPATYSGGVYFESQMSNRIYTSSELITSILNLKIGDGRVIVDFNASATMDSAIFKKVIVFKYTDTSVEKTGNPAYGALAGLGSLADKDVSTSQSGEFTLSGLTNNTPYNVSIAFLDKFQFATTFSDSRLGTPLEIQELLKKTSCFLLTAGFGEEHEVITFFRQYRDQVLSKVWIGQEFIKVYYRLAPHYAEIIYKHDSIRFAIRTFAYALYFLFKYCWLILLFLISCYYLNGQKNKLLLDETSL